MIYPIIFQAEQDGLVLRTFRRLDPERQQALIDAILAEAAEVGPDKIRVQEIARRANVSTGSMYQYFPDRSHLLDFTIRVCTYTWEEMFDQYMPELAKMPLRDGLRAYLVGGLEMGELQKGVVQILGRMAYMDTRGKFKTLIDSLAKKMLDGVKGMLVEAQNRKEIRADIDLEASSRLINTFLIALGDSQLFPHLNDYYLLTNDEVKFSRILDAALVMIMDGLGAGDDRKCGEKNG